MMKQLLIFLSTIAISYASFAQNETSVNWYGFVRNAYYVDTYKSVNAVYDNFYLLPLYTGKTADGEDINEVTSSNLTAIASRLGAKVTGPELFGAKSSATIEFDFGGITGSEPTLFRIRHACMNLNWEKSSLLIGQYWHPMWCGANYPHIGSLNTGSPYQPFNRSPQIQYSYKTSKLTLSAAAVYQCQFTTASLESASNANEKTLAKRNGVLPEIVGTVEYKTEAFTLGAVGGLNVIKPKTTVTNNAGELFHSDEMLYTPEVTAYIKYSKDKLYILAKGVYGENLSHLTMQGGFGVKTYDANTGKETYTAYKNYTTLLNIVYGKKVQIGTFLGFSDNLGTNDALHEFSTGTPETAGLYNKYGLMVHQSFRTSAYVGYNIKNFRFVAEYERTTADYGVGTFNFSDGLYSDTHRTANNRLLLMMMYIF